MKYASTFTFGLVLAATAFMAKPAISLAADDDTTRIVKFRDLDLGTTDGATLLYRRLSVAADQVCSQYSHGRAPRHHQIYKDCVNEALSGAVLRVNAPELTALYRSKSAQRPERMAQNTSR